MSLEQGRLVTESVSEQEWVSVLAGGLGAAAELCKQLLPSCTHFDNGPPATPVTQSRGCSSGNLD